MPNQAQTLDRRLSARAARREAAYFAKVRNAETSYAVQLRKVARQVGDLVRQFSADSPAAVAELVSVLNGYAGILRPWARAVAERMIAEVARRDEQAWFKASQDLGRNLRQEIRSAPVGSEVRRILEEQVQLITSIPVDAARRVQSLSVEYLSGGRRYQELVPMILASGQVAASRATLIARTETAKASSSLMEARARYVGANQYIWRTVMDRDVRPAHKRLEGTVHSWDEPPVAEANGERHHPGAFPNCRCFAEPIIPDVIQ